MRAVAAEPDDRPHHERIGTTTWSEIARILGVSGNWLAQLRRKKGLPRAAWGRYDVAEVVHWFIAYQTRGDDPDAVDQVVEARRGLYDVQTRLRQAELDQLERSLIPLEQARQAFLAACTTIAGELGALGPRVASEIAGLTDPDAIIRVIGAECDRIRANGSAALLARLDSAGGGVDPSPPSPA
jgi:hypothetical protein